MQCTIVEQNGFLHKHSSTLYSPERTCTCTVHIKVFLGKALQQSTEREEKIFDHDYGMIDEQMVLSLRSGHKMRRNDYISMTTGSFQETEHYTCKLM